MKGIWSKVPENISSLLEPINENPRKSADSAIYNYREEDYVSKRRVQILSLSLCQTTLGGQGHPQVATIGLQNLATL